MALQEEKIKKIIPPENEFMIKFQPLIMICDKQDHQNNLGIKSISVMSFFLYSIQSD